LYQANLLDNFTQITQLLLVMFVFMILSNGFVEVTIMKMEQDSRAGLKNQEFLITEYMTQINLMNQRLIRLLLLLFVSFTDESDLVGDGQSASRRGLQ